MYIEWGCCKCTYFLKSLQDSACSCSCSYPVSLVDWTGRLLITDLSGYLVFLFCRMLFTGYLHVMTSDCAPTTVRGPSRGIEFFVLS